MDYQIVHRETFTVTGKRIHVSHNNSENLRTIPAATWAKFTAVGPLPGAIHALSTRIFEEWFPATAYEHTGGPEGRETRSPMTIAARSGFPSFSGRNSHGLYLFRMTACWPRCITFATAQSGPKLDLPEQATKKRAWIVRAGSFLPAARCDRLGDHHALFQ